jgi:catalase-peroxidase
MLTADLALKEDPSYNTYVVQFANSQADLDRAFSHAWYKLTARDMGPVDRCVGNLVPAAQPWQYPLPAPPSALPDFSKVSRHEHTHTHTHHPLRPPLFQVREDIVAALSRSVSTATPDTVNGAVYYGAQLIELARRCAGS